MTRGAVSGRTLATWNASALRRLVEEGRASGEPVDGEAALKRLRDKYAAMALKIGRRPGDDP